MRIPTQRIVPQYTSKSAPINCLRESQTKSNMGKRIITDEIEIEVPYGKIKAKTWHEETDECVRVLALHGWMDNAGSFDKIVPLLDHPDGLFIVAPDLPGHGRSSQIPPGSSYSDLTMLVEIRRIVKQLNWGKSVNINGLCNNSNSTNNDDTKDDIVKFTIIGHSLGAGLGLFYASMHPDEVEQVITIDFLKSRTQDGLGLLATTARTIDEFIDLVPSVTVSGLTSPSSTPRMSGRSNDRGSVIVSTETAIVATIDAHASLGKLSRDEAQCLLKRSTVAVSSPPNSVIYARDLRLQAMLNFREHIHLNSLMFQGVRCHFVAILATNGFYNGTVEFCLDNVDEFLKILKSACASCNLCWVEGDHYIHMNNSEKTAKIINEALREPGSLNSKDEIKPVGPIKYNGKNHNLDNLSYIKKDDGIQANKV